MVLNSDHVTVLYVSAPRSSFLVLTALFLSHTNKTAWAALLIYARNNT